MQPETPQSDAGELGRSKPRRLSLFYIEVVVVGAITIAGVVMGLLSAARAILSALGW